MSRIDRNSPPVVHGALHEASYGGWWFEGQSNAPIYWADEVDALMEKMRGGGISGEGTKSQVGAYADTEDSQRKAASV